MLFLVEILFSLIILVLKIFHICITCEVIFGLIFILCFQSQKNILIMIVLHVSTVDIFLIFDEHFFLLRPEENQWVCNMYYVIILTDDRWRLVASSGCISVCSLCTSWIYSGLADEIMSSSL